MSDPVDSKWRLVDNGYDAIYGPMEKVKWLKQVARLGLPAQEAKALSWFHRIFYIETVEGYKRAMARVSPYEDHVHHSMPSSFKLQVAAMVYMDLLKYVHQAAHMAPEEIEDNNSRDGLGEGEERLEVVEEGDDYGRLGEGI